MDPDILALCETKKAGRTKKDVLSACDIIEKPLKQGKEGLMLCVRKGSFTSIREITDTELKQLLTVRIVYPSVCIRVIVVHAPQETDTVEKRQEFFEELSVQIERCIMSGDEMLIMGDLNARIGSEGHKIVPLENSPNGKELSQLILIHNLHAANFHQNCEGKWTRIQACKDGTTKKSVLDYILMQQSMYDKLVRLEIDEEKIYCPYRETFPKGKRKIVYSDHCVMIADLEIDIGRVSKDNEKRCGWKFNDEGFEQYQLESELKLEYDDGGESATRIYESWAVAFEKLLSRCFRRRTFTTKNCAKITNTRHKMVRAIISDIGKKGKIQRGIAKLYQQKLVIQESCKLTEARAERLKKTTESLTVNERFSPTGYWKMKKAADKGTRREQIQSSVILGNEVELEGEKAIIEAYQEEFERRLGNRPPEKGWEDYTEETNRTVRMWLQGESVSSPPFSHEEKNSVIRSLKEDCSPGIDNNPPKLFTKAGAGVVDSVLTLCNRIKTLKDIPEQWNLVRIVTIYKKKGSKKELKYYRGIFLTIVISKIFEKLIKGRIEKHLNKINLLQGGSRKNRGPPDNVFLFRGVMDHFKFTKKTLHVTAYDFEQAFDSLWLEDCVLSLKQLGVEKEYLQLIYNLNKQAGVVVQTPFGPTPVFQTAPIVKQLSLIHI